MKFSGHVLISRLPNAFHCHKNRSFFNTLIGKALDLRSITAKIQDQESIEAENYTFRGDS